MAEGKYNIDAVTARSEPQISQKLHAVGRMTGTPVSGTFELTSRCNFNCRMCYIHDDSAVRGKELTAGEWLDLGRQAADAGTVFLLLTGGEPLLRPDFEEIYVGLKKLGLMVSVNTNGSLITGRIEELFGNNPPVRLNISLYAPDNDGYTALCGAPAYDLVAGNIERMVSAGVPVKLNVSFAGQNAASCERLAELVSTLGLPCQTSVYMYPPVRTGNPGRNADRLSPEEAARLRIKWDCLAGSNGKLRSAAGLIEELSRRECEDAVPPAEGVRCRAGHTSYWISSEGRMLMCGMIPVDCGDVLSEGFGKCWLKTRELMRSVVMPAKCSACALRPVCPVCPAACYAETGIFSAAPEYLCEMSACLSRGLLSMDREEEK